MRVSTREKWMLHSLVFVLILIWFSFVNNRYSEKSRLLKEVKQELIVQNVWIQNSEKINAKLDQALSSFESSKSLNSAGLTAFVDTIVRDLKLEHDLNTEDSSMQKVYNKHTVTIRIQDTQLMQLLLLESEIAQQYPTINMETIAITPNKANPNILNAAMKINTYELN